ncbi:redoxin domain-containing protein [Spirillospora sp. NPDC047279]|uniref:TlpA family protein disulfide reductase n=1 Tax=Spirillospora sp. NPDC047279 TaxID=3155478 RepID=UPI00340B3D3C
MRELPVTVAVTLAFALAGCGGGTDGDGADGGTPTAGPSSTAGTPGAASPGAGSPGASPGAGSPGAGSPSARLRSLPAPLKFEATTLDGRPFTGGNLAEQPVVFWFWTPSCAGCQEEGRAVAAAAREYQGRVTFVGVAGRDRSGERPGRFVTRTGTGGITQLDDRSGGLSEHFEVTSRPSFLFMRRDGSADRAAGPLGAETLDERVRALAGG